MCKVCVSYYLLEKYIYIVVVYKLKCFMVYGVFILR